MKHANAGLVKVVTGPVRFGVSLRLSTPKFKVGVLRFVVPLDYSYRVSCMHELSLGFTSLVHSSPGSIEKTSLGLVNKHYIRQVSQLSRKKA